MLQDYKLEVEEVSGDVLCVELKVANISSSEASTEFITLKSIELTISDGVSIHMRRIVSHN